MLIPRVGETVHRLTMIDKVEREAVVEGGKSRLLRFSGIANTGEADVDGFIIPAESFAESLDDFMKNPVILHNHDRDHVIGRGEKVEPGKDGLRVQGVLDMEDDYAAQIGGQMERDFIRGISVGFRIMAEPKSIPGGKLVFPKNRLMEFSIVALPADPGALVGASSEAEITRALASVKERFLDELREAVKELAATAVEERVGTVRDLAAKSIEKTNAKAYAAFISELRIMRDEMLSLAKGRKAEPEDPLARLERFFAGAEVPAEPVTTDG